MNLFTKYNPLLLLVVLLVSPPLAANNSNSPEQKVAQKIVHILDYIAVDYANVVQNGRVTNQDEYAEQKEFSAHLLLLVDQLPAIAGKSFLKQNASQISKAIQQHLPGDNVTALCNITSLRVIELFHVEVAPRVAPVSDNVAELFQENCAMCHGAQGFGDGPRAVDLQPAPANFHFRERQQHRSILSLYNTISLGVAGTAMPSYEQFTPQQRWQLAFYVSTFLFTEDERAKGEAILSSDKSIPVISNLRQLTQITPAQATSKFGADGLAELAYLRSNPAELQANINSPIQVAKNNLKDSLVAYRLGDHQTSYDLAVAAYLEGFELTEAQLNSTAPDLRLRIESAMLKYRDMIKHRANLTEVQDTNTLLISMLSTAQEKLDTSDLSSSVNFLSAFLILLREGLEAILILAAISAVLIKTGRSDMLRYLHIGWVTALLLGGVTWFIAGQFFNISGASREMTEGITALISAAMLIYVGFWLHKQAYAMQWQQFIRAKVSQSLTGSALTGMAVVAFIAVYREVFESILFFQTLWLQTSGDGHTQVMSGILTAAATLVLIAWGVFKFSVRLPLKLFFRINSVFLYLLAIVFAGKGIAALQEAGKLRVDPVNFFKIDALGIYPNIETLGIQVSMIFIAVLLYVFSRNKLSRENKNG